MPCFTEDIPSGKVQLDYLHWLVFRKETFARFKSVTFFFFFVRACCQRILKLSSNYLNRRSASLKVWFFWFHFKHWQVFFYWYVIFVHLQFDFFSFFISMSLSCLFLSHARRNEITIWCPFHIAFSSKKFWKHSFSRIFCCCCCCYLSFFFFLEIADTFSDIRHQPPHHTQSLTPYWFTTSKWIFWLYILGVQFNFYQNITEICILFSNKVLGTAIHFILYTQHLTNICQLEWKLKLRMIRTWSFTVMLVFRKFCLTTKQNGIVNCWTGYFSSKISSQKWSSCKKKWNMYPFVHTKKICSIWM